MRRGELRGLSNLAASGVMFAAAVPYTARGRPSSHLGHGTPHVSRGFPPTHLKGQDVQTLIALHTWSHEDESDRRGKIVVGRIVVGRIVVGRIVVGRIVVGRIVVGDSVGARLAASKVSRWLVT